MKPANPLNDFFKNEKAGGILLLTCTVISLVLANSPFQDSYMRFWKLVFAGHSFDHWINEGLMTIFFLVVGLELKRELYNGELSSVKTAMLPVFAALGGMVVPAGIYFWLNYGTPTQAGAGIPMATDIVFALAALSFMGKRIPAGLKIFLTALAVIDDLGAILAIAIFYSGKLSIMHLATALGIFVFLMIINRLNVRNILPYLAGGIAMWYFMQHSGIHATTSGVLLALAIPMGNNDEQSMSYKLQHLLHKPVSFLIVPIFTLANTAIIIHGSLAEIFATSNGRGIFFGLFIGKPAGIFLFSWLAVSMGICIKPANIRWSHIACVGLLGGIGFTISIFVTLLAFGQGLLSDACKIIIIVTSAISAITGLLFLHFTLAGNIAGSTMNQHS